MLVHVGRTCYTVLLPSSQQSKQLRPIANVHVSKSFDVTSLFVLTYSQILFWYLQQVTYFLQVNLEYRHFELVLHCLSRPPNLCKQLFDQPRHDPFFLLITQIVSLHRECLPRTSLPVGHDRPIESVQDVAQHRSTNNLENLLLRSLWIKNLIKHKWNLFLFVILDQQMVAIRKTIQSASPKLGLFAIERTESTTYLYIASTRLSPCLTT